MYRAAFLLVDIWQHKNRHSEHLMAASATLLLGEELKL
jgi:hypothetical protein